MCTETLTLRICSDVSRKPSRIPQLLCFNPPKHAYAQYAPKWLRNPVYLGKPVISEVIQISNLSSLEGK